MDADGTSALVVIVTHVQQMLQAAVGQIPLSARGEGSWVGRKVVEK